jgi:hypothetical protein
MLGRHDYGAQVSVDLRLGPFEQLGQDPVDVGDDRERPNLSGKLTCSRLVGVLAGWHGGRL